MTKVSSEIGALRWLTTVCKYNITVYFGEQNKSVKLYYFILVTFSCPTIREPENAAMISLLIAIAIALVGVSLRFIPV